MKTWEEKDKEWIWHPFTALEGAPAPLFIESAEGVYLHTSDGRKIMDAVSSWWVNIHGHCHPEIVKAIAHQAQKLEHVIFAGFTHEPAITLAENLLRLLPPNFSKIFFSDNGSTAVEIAIKLSIQFWKNQGIKKNKIIAIQGSYHGDTFGAMSVGDRNTFTKVFSDYLFEVEFIDFPTPENEKDVLHQFEEQVSSGTVAAFIFEPLVQAVAGMKMYSPECLNQLLILSRQNNVITIADEVFTGFGRTGKTFAIDHLQQRPDLMALSKGITGGSLPLGVTVCSQKIVEAFTSSEAIKTFFHGHSFTANPITCAAANASIRLLLNKDCQDSIQRIHTNHQKFTDSIKNRPSVKEARCLGTIVAIELNTGSHTSYFNTIRSKIYSYFLDRQILLRPLGNILYFLPPYVITQEQMNEVYQAIRAFLNELERQDDGV
jgi:adenosylmethionine-8-amino-7-oxononanoate aminotransferase